MQKYMLLSAQKEALQRKMELEVPFSKPITATLPDFQSLSTSPAWSPKYASPSPYPSAIYAISSSVRAGPTAQSIDDTHTEESHKLAEINHQIVATLTELLNTESVRSDDRHRAWIQERLMDAEHQIRRQRRRHSSNAERDFASAIAHQLELTLHTSKTWA